MIRRRRHRRFGKRAAPPIGRGAARFVAWLVIASMLGLLFMPLAGPARAAAAGLPGGPARSLSHHLQHQGQLQGHGLHGGHGQRAGAIPAAGHAAKGHGAGCSFCVAHPGFSLPPPVPAGVAAAPEFGAPPVVAMVEAERPDLEFLTARPTRAPPGRDLSAIA